MNNDNQHIPTGYKSSPLGIVPEDWEVKRLGEVGSFSKGSGVPKDKIISEGHPCLTYGDLYTKYDFVIKDIKSFIDEETSKESKEINAGDICFAGSGETPEDIGKCAAYLENCPAYAGGDIVILSPNNNINSLWLSYLLNSDIGGKQRYKFAQGFSIVHIYPDNLKQIQIPVPPLPEQQRIVSVLSLWDTAIAKQTALIEKLTLRKRGLMQQLLTGKKRLKGFEGGSFHRLGNYISECNRRNNGCNRVLSVTNTRGFILQEEQFDKIVASNDTSNYKVVRRGEFAYNPSRVNVGSLAMLKEYDEGILSPMYIVFKANENIDKTYLLQCLQSWWFRGHIPAYTQGSVRDSLSFDGLCSMKFYIPTLQEQKAISAILERADKEIEIQKQKLAAMQAQKKGLMQVLLTGKKRIN